MKENAFDKRIERKNCLKLKIFVSVLFVYDKSGIQRLTALFSCAENKCCFLTGRTTRWKVYQDV